MAIGTPRSVAFCHFEEPGSPQTSRRVLFETNPDAIPLLRSISSDISFAVQRGERASHGAGDGQLVNVLPPDLNAVRSVLVDLIDGRISREAAADRANPWVIDFLPQIDDPAVWTALTDLCGAGLQVSPNEDLLSSEDFQVWLTISITTPARPCHVDAVDAPSCLVL